MKEKRHKMALIKVIIIVLIGLYGIHGRFLSERNCFKVRSTLRCIRLNRPPRLRPNTVKDILTLDMRGSQIHDVKVLRVLETWPQLKRVDIRNQISFFDCSFEDDFTFELITDCNELSSTSGIITEISTFTTISVEPTNSTTRVTPRPRARTTTTSTPSTSLPTTTRKRITPRPRARTTTRPTPSTSLLTTTRKRITPRPKARTPTTPTTSTSLPTPTRKRITPRLRTTTVSTASTSVPTTTRKRITPRLRTTTVSPTSSSVPTTTRKRITPRPRARNTATSTTSTSTATRTRKHATLRMRTGTKPPPATLTSPKHITDGAIATSSVTKREPTRSANHVNMTTLPTHPNVNGHVTPTLVHIMAFINITLVTVAVIVVIIISCRLLYRRFFKTFWINRRMKKKDKRSDNSSDSDPSVVQFELTETRPFRKKPKTTGRPRTRARRPCVLVEEVGYDGGIELGV